MKNFCPHCGVPLKENASFCSNCGNRISDISPRKRLQESPVTSETTAAAPCPQPTPAPELVARPVSPQRSRKVPYIVVGAAVLGAVIALLAVWYLFGFGREEAPPETPAPSQMSTPVPTLAATQTPTPVSTVPPTPQPYAEDIIASIRARYYAVQDNMNAYEVVADGAETRYYDPADASLVRLDEDRGEGMGSIFYYDHGNLYFIYTFENGVEDRYYFDNAQLVLWLHRTGAGETAYEGADSHPEYNRISGQWLAESIRHDASVRYRVRRSYGDAESQIGAFAELQNAKDAADANAGYKVYTMYGEPVYTP